jgi:hypothetical protein
MRSRYVSIPIANTPKSTPAKRTPLVEKRARAVCAGLARPVLKKLQGINDDKGQHDQTN